MTKMIEEQIANAKRMVEEDQSFDELKIQELELRSVEEKDELMTNDQKASIVGIVALIVIT